MGHNSHKADHPAALRITIKQRQHDAQWQTMPLISFAGKSIRQALLQLDGSEVVVELSYDGKKRYLCGTDEWCDWTRKNLGHAMRIKQAVETLNSKFSQVVDEVIPHLDVIDQVFNDLGCCRIESHTGVVDQ